MPQIRDRIKKLKMVGIDLELAEESGLITVLIHQIKNGKVLTVPDGVEV